mgnify:CR=1 FL=1
MSHIQTYLLIEATSLRDLHLQVNGFLGEGWELHGSPQVAHTLTHNEYGMEILDIYFYQAMVLLKPEEGKGEG